MSGDADLADRSLVRRLWWLWMPVALLILVALLYTLTRTSLLDVDRIEVEGAGPRVTEWAVLEVAAIEVGQPLFDLDLDAVDGRLTALPWVAEATVAREWSGTVRLRILERPPVVVAVDLGTIRRLIRRRCSALRFLLHARGALQPAAPRTIAIVCAWSFS